MHRLFPLMIAAFLCSCVSNVELQRITATTRVPNGRALIVNDAFTHGRFDFPGGKYSVVWRDGGGVYYQAPEKVIAHFLLPAGASPVDGGIYVSAGEPVVLRAYIAESSYPPYKPPPGEPLQINYHFVD